MSTPPSPDKVGYPKLPGGFASQFGPSNMSGNTNPAGPSGSGTGKPLDLPRTNPFGLTVDTSSNNVPSVSGNITTLTKNITKLTGSVETLHQLPLLLIVLSHLFPFLHLLFRICFPASLFTRSALLHCPALPRFTILVSRCPCMSPCMTQPPV